MSAPLQLRDDMDGQVLRRFANAARDAVLKRRALAIASIYDGASRQEAAVIGGVGKQVVRDWVLRFNLEGLDGLYDRSSPGMKKLTPEAELEVARLYRQRPRPSSDEMVELLLRRHKISIAPRTLYEYFRKFDSKVEERPKAPQRLVAEQHGPASNTMSA